MAFSKEKFPAVFTGEDYLCLFLFKQPFPQQVFGCDDLIGQFFIDSQFLYKEENQAAVVFFCFSK